MCNDVGSQLDSQLARQLCHLDSKAVVSVSQLVNQSVGQFAHSKSARLLCR